MTLNSKDEFLTYASLYAAYVDLDLHEDEIVWIRDQFGIELYERIHNQFKKQSEFTNLQTIIDHKEVYFPGQSGTQDLLLLMKDLFHIDGDYSTLEKISFSFLTNYLRN